MLEASGALVTDSPQEAFEFAQEHKWLPANAREGDNAGLGNISLLLMRSFEMRGGIMYTITKSARYAYRELVYKNVIQGRRDSFMSVSGGDLLYYVNRILAMKGETPAVTQEMEIEDTSIIEEQSDGENAILEN